MMFDLQIDPATFAALLSSQRSIARANAPSAATSSSSNRQEKFNQLANDEYE
jgi:hypothetical protein